MIYYGDEVGLLGENDPDCRRCFPWQKHEQNHAVFEMTQRLIKLRKSHTCFRYGKPQTLAFFNGVYAFRQVDQEDEAIVIVNPREGIANIKIPTNSAKQTWQTYDEKHTFTAENGALTFEYIPASAAMVLLPVDA